MKKTVSHGDMLSVDTGPYSFGPGIEFSLKASHLS